MRPWRRALPSTRKRRYILLAILILSLASKALWQIHLGEVTFGEKDERGYEQVALSLARTGTFSQSPEDGAAPAYYHPPGYPMLVAFIYKTTGEHRGAVIAFQTLLVTGVVLAGFVLGRVLFGEEAGLVIAGLMSIEPLLFTFSGQFMAETLNAALLFFSMCCLFAMLRSRTRPRLFAAGAGITLALATYVRSTTFYVPVLAGLALVILLWPRRGIRSASVLALWFCLPAVLLTGVWQVRNVESVGSWRFTGVEGYAIYAYGAVGIEAERSHGDESAIRERALQEFGDARSDERIGEYYDRMHAEGTKRIRSEPVLFGRSAAKGAVAVALGVNYSVFPYLGMPQPPRWLEVAARLALVGFWLLIAFGAFRIWRDRKEMGDVFVGHVIALLVVTYSLLSAGAFAATYSRLRTPIMPLLCVYAGYGAWKLYSLARRRPSDAPRADGHIAPVDTGSFGQTP